MKLASLVNSFCFDCVRTHFYQTSMYYIDKIRSLEDISWISTYRLIFNSLCSHSICIDTLCQAYVFPLCVDNDLRLIYNDHIQIKDMFVSYSLCLCQKSIWTRFYLPCLHIVKRSSRVVGVTRLRVLSALQHRSVRARQTRSVHLSIQ